MAMAAASIARITKLNKSQSMACGEPITRCSVHHSPMKYNKPVMMPTSPAEATL
jgi:hypothetical protein